MALILKNLFGQFRNNSTKIDLKVFVYQGPLNFIGIKFTFFSCLVLRD